MIGHLVLIPSTALLLPAPHTTCAPKFMPFPRRGSRGHGGVLCTAPPRSQRCASPPQDSLPTPPRARAPAKPAPGPLLRVQAHTTYKRKDSTSQSSAASMATIASRTPLPSGNLPGREPTSREKWTRQAQTWRAWPQARGRGLELRDWHYRRCAPSPG